MEKSTKIWIGVGVVGVIGLLLYKKANATTSVTKTGGLLKKPTTKPSVPSVPSNPIIDPNTGKLKPPASSTDTTDPSNNPQFDMSKGIGSGGGSGIPSGGKGGGGGATNTPDLSSGRFKKVDPNAKDENWIKALQKKQKAGSGQKGKKPSPKVDCYENPYDPTCQKVKDCYYNPYDPSCQSGEYDYTASYDNNTYTYDYPHNYGYDYSAGGGYVYDYSGGGYVYDGSGSGYQGGYSNGGYYSGYSYSGGAWGGGPSDFGYLYY